ncbi:MAG: hypothetical protein LBM93_00130 [Oscillospiraceae bacterium]|nr:hypothetical protein [Oscillospiraceae bacterium]
MESNGSSNQINEKFMTEYMTRKRERIFSCNSDFDGELTDKNYDDKSDEMDFHSVYGKKTAVYCLREETRGFDRTCPSRAFIYKDFDFKSSDYNSIHKDIQVNLVDIVRIKPVSEDELRQMRMLLFECFSMFLKKRIKEYKDLTKGIEEFHIGVFKDLFVDDTVDNIKNYVEGNYES